MCRLPCLQREATIDCPARRRTPFDHHGHRIPDDHEVGNDHDCHDGDHETANATVGHGVAGMDDFGCRFDGPGFGCGPACPALDYDQDFGDGCCGAYHPSCLDALCRNCPQMHFSILKTNDYDYARMTSRHGVGGMAKPMASDSPKGTRHSRPLVAGTTEFHRKPGNRQSRLVIWYYYCLPLR
jgi:hypothetical protein